MGWGVSKVWKGAKKRVKQVFSGVAKTFRKIGRELKRFAKTGLGKVVLAAVAIYTGGALYGMYAGGMGASAWAPAAAFQNAGAAVGLNAHSAGFGAGASAGGAAGGAVAAEGAAGGVAGSGTSSSFALDGAASTINTGVAEGSVASGNALTAEGAKQAANQTFAMQQGQGALGKVTGDLAANEAAQIAAGNAGELTASSGFGGKVGGYLSSVANNPLAQYGLLHDGCNAVAASNEPDAAKEAAELAARERQHVLDTNLAPTLSTAGLASVNFTNPTQTRMNETTRPSNRPAGMLSQAEQSRHV